MDYIENKIFSEINVGDSASLEHRLTIKDIELFAIMSGDVNPAHVDIEFAKDDMFHGIIAHGMWGGFSYIYITRYNITWARYDIFGSNT
jgi:phosphate acetyltransferase